MYTNIISHVSCVPEGNRQLQSIDLIDYGHSGICGGNMLFIIWMNSECVYVNLLITLYIDYIDIALHIFDIMHIYKNMSQGGFH